MRHAHGQQDEQETDGNVDRSDGRGGSRVTHQRDRGGGQDRQPEDGEDDDEKAPPPVGGTTPVLNATDRRAAVRWCRHRRISSEDHVSTG